jgi:hypothetical protein
MNPQSSQALVAEKLQQLERQRMPLPTATPYDKLTSELMSTLGRATSPVVIEHLSTALSFVQKARLSASQQGASRT